MPALLFSLHTLQSRKQAWWLGFLLSAMVAWGGFPWIIYVMQNFGGMPFWVAFILLWLYCLVAAPQMVAFMVLGERLRFSVEQLPLFLRPLFWASFYVALEYLAHFIKIFPENLGNTLIKFLPLAQAASLGGAPLLSFLPLWIGASAYYLKKSGVKKALPSFAASVALMIALHIWGQYELKHWHAQPFKNFRAGIVQHNIDEIDKLSDKMGARNAFDYTVRHLLSLTNDLVEQNKNLDLIVWPETSFPLSFPAKAPTSNTGMFAFGYANLVKELIRSKKVPLLMGGYDSEVINGVEKTYNAGILLNSDGQGIASYRKRELLLFGEYIPFSDTFPIIKDLNPQMGDFSRGAGAEPITLPTQKFGEVNLGVNICYEAILPEYMRGYAKRSINLFVNLTKDSWFGDTFEPYQHFQLSQLRSIEHRIPMLRATNSGLSGVIWPTGEIELLSTPFQEVIKAVDVPIYETQTKTLYTLLGEWFAWLMLFHSIGMILWMRKQA